MEWVAFVKGVEAVLNYMLEAKDVKDLKSVPDHEVSCRKYPISAETVRKYVAENRLTERDRLLLRGNAAMRGFAGCLDHSLNWLERFSPGVGARFRGGVIPK